jgi:glycosyltransferase involved in cell wall biosynthesis
MGNFDVLFTCRNSEKIIEPSLTSLMEQSIKPKYIIIIDDGSSDNTLYFKTNSKKE